MSSLEEKIFVLLRIWGWMWAKVFLLFEVVLDVDINFWRGPSQFSIYSKAPFGRREWNGMEWNKRNIFRIFFPPLVWEF